MAALNPGQFKGPLYHGTTYDLQGNDIKPGKVFGKSNWGKAGHSGQYSDEHAFATESEHTAWEFGSRAGMMRRAVANSVANPDPNSVWTKLDAEHGTKQPVPDVARVRVHEVAPHPLMQMGVYHAEHRDHLGGHSEDLKEWRAPAFRRTGTIDTMPGRQGTFPSLNWNQFRGPNSGYADDMNHPTDSNIAEGHAPAKDADAILAHMRKNGHLEEYKRPDPSAVDEHQMDLFSGKTVGEHAEKDGSPVGDYHRNNLFGRL